MTSKRVFNTYVDTADDDGLRQTLVSLLRQAKEADGVSFRELERRSGISNPNIIRALRGNADPSTLTKLFRALGASVEIKVRLPRSTGRPPTG